MEKQPKLGFSLLDLLNFWQQDSWRELSQDTLEWLCLVMAQIVHGSWGQKLLHPIVFMMDL